MLDVQRTILVVRTTTFNGLMACHIPEVGPEIHLFQESRECPPALDLVAKRTRSVQDRCGAVREFFESSERQIW